MSCIQKRIKNNNTIRKVRNIHTQCLLTLSNRKQAITITMVDFRHDNMLCQYSGSGLGAQFNITVIISHE